MISSLRMEKSFYILILRRSIKVIFMGKNSLKKKVFFAVVTAAVSSVASYLVTKALKGKKKPKTTKKRKTVKKNKK